MPPWLDSIMIKNRELGARTWEFMPFVPFIHLKAKPFFLPVSRKLVIEGLALTESWIKGYSLRFINSFSAYLLPTYYVPALNKKAGNNYPHVIETLIEGLKNML